MTAGAGWRIEVILPADEQPDELENILAQSADAVSVFRHDASDGWRLTAYQRSKPDEKQIQAIVDRATGGRYSQLVIEPVQDCDWVAMANSCLPPLEIGMFHVYGSHTVGAGGQVGVLIDAGQAFGTGHHASTWGCLQAFQELYTANEGPRRALDLGTGSGILAIALARAFGTSVLAVDVDRVAVDVACRNAALNEVSELVATLVSDGFSHLEIRGRSPFDLIVANIVAGPLIELASDIADSLGPNGRAVLSGLLVSQEAQVSEIYADLGFAVLKRFREEEWATLVLGIA